MLHLEENAILRFTDNPSDYLPAVMTSWEGMECYNYSPLLYAMDCENIAITGKGTLAPIMDTWKIWFKRPKPHMDALKELYTMASNRCTCRTASDGKRRKSSSSSFDTFQPV